MRGVEQLTSWATLFSLSRAYCLFPHQSSSSQLGRNRRSPIQI